MRTAGRRRAFLAEGKLGLIDWCRVTRGSHERVSTGRPGRGENGASTDPQWHGYCTVSGHGRG